MAITRSTRALVDRALTRREAVERAELAAALRTHAERAAAALRLDQAIAAEEAHVGAAEPWFPVAAWRAAARTRLDAAHAATALAEQACEAPRDRLSDTRRTARGFETLMARQDAETARAAERRDPLAQLMLLPAAAG